MPDTIAENRNTMGIRTELHHGFALTEPKMKPTYPWRRNADGMPMMVMALIAFLSNSTDFSLVSVEKSEMIR